MTSKVIHDILCTACSALFDVKWESNVFYQHTRQTYIFSEMLESSYKRYHLCSLITAEILQYKEVQASLQDSRELFKTMKDGIVPVNVKLRYHERNLTNPFYINIAVDWPEKTRETLFRLKVDLYTPVHEEDSGRSLTSSSTSSRDTIQRVNQWLDECISTQCNHSAKRSNSLGTFIPHSLPTRLLDVGKEGEGERSNIRLVKSNMLPRDSPYISLSHCWGKTNVIRLLEEELSLFEREILFRSLPLTFQHTVLIARKLNVRYVWIDSLCIIQDSIDDWQREAARMTEVYRHAWLNITATASHGSEEGLFRARSPLTVNLCRIKTIWEGFPTSVLSVSRHQDHLAELSCAPLNKRGWVSQERLLSQRTVHFGHAQVYWECATNFASEAAPNTPGSPTDMKELMIGDIQNITGDLCTRCLTAWTQIIRSYCDAALTVPSDKLVAISGLARRMYEFSNGELGNYVAGMWEARLVSQLCWSTGPLFSRRPSKYRGPSWSWASVDGAWVQNMPSGTQNHYDKNWNIRAEVESTHLEYAFDRYGSITGGSLSLKCTLFNIQIATKREDVEVPVRRPRCVRVGAHEASSSHWINNLTIFLDDKTEQALADLHIVPLYVLPLQVSTLKVGKKPEKDMPPNLMDCLILKPTCSGRGQYQRVGLLRSQNDKNYDCIEDACASLLLDKEMYVEMNDAKKYTIQII